jgi:hypothetical protein
MKITKRQLRKIIREAWDPGPDDETLEISPADGVALQKAGYGLGALVRAVDFVGDEWGGDWEKTVGEEIGTIVDIDDSEDGPIQFVVNWSTGAPTMTDSSELELIKEGNSTDPRGLKTLLASLNVKGRDFRPVANALAVAYHDFEGGPQDMKDEVEIHSGGLSTSTDGEWIDWPIETYQEIWNLYKKARQSYRSPQASGVRW